MLLGIANDHAGFEHKTQLVEYLKKKGIDVKDFGANTSQSSDYADYAHPLAEAIEKKLVEKGIAICGSGNGINMTLNKHQGVRAALCWNKEISYMARLHNDANICSLPARFITFDEAVEIIETFLNTAFEGGRHCQRIGKIPVK